MVRRIPGRILHLLFLFRSFSPFFYLDSDPPTTQSLFLGRNARRSTRREGTGNVKGPVRTQQFLFSFLFLFHRRDSWNRPLRAGPHRVSAMFQLGIPPVVRERRRGGKRRERRWYRARSVNRPLERISPFNRPPSGRLTDASSNLKPIPPRFRAG